MCRNAIKVGVVFASMFIADVTFAQNERVPFDAPQNAEVMEWRGVPLNVSIPVKEDRVIRFTQSRRMQVGIPTDLQGVVSAETFNGVVYLRSQSAFDEMPFWFRDKDSGAIYRIDIKSSIEPGNTLPIVVIDPQRPEIPVDSLPELSELPDSPEDELELGSAVPETEVVEVEYSGPIRHGVGTLTRFAFQNIYAPERLITQLDDVHQLEIEEKEIPHMLVGSRVSARTIAQWSNEGRYVTALLLQNHGKDVARVDPRMLRGNRYWETASLISDRLNPKNQYGDTTALVVISDRPWEENEKWLH